MKIELTTYKRNIGAKEADTHMFMYSNDGHFIFTGPISKNQKEQILAACHGNNVPILIEDSNDKSVTHYYIRG